VVNVFYCMLSLFTLCLCVSSYISLWIQVILILVWIKFLVLTKWIHPRHRQGFRFLNEFCTRNTLLKYTKPAAKPVPTYEGTGTPYRDCTRGCDNRGQSWPMMSAIHVTANTFFERLYLVIGLRKIVPWVNCPYARTTPTVRPTTISRVLCNFFPPVAPHFFDDHDSPVIWPSPDPRVYPSRISSWSVLLE